MLADMMLDAQFATAELEREKGVVIQELKMYEDNPLAVVHEKWQRYFLGENSYGRPIIGFEENILRFDREQILNYKNSLYTKDNLIITIAGNINNQAQLEDMICELFQHLPQQKTRKKPDFHWTLPKEHSAYYSKKTEQNHLIISMPGLHGLQEERYAARLLCTMLGGNMSSRLFQEIREKLGLCYYISASHASNPEFGIFSIRAGLEKEKFRFGIERIEAEIDAFIANSFDDEELENAKSYLEGSIQMGIESSDEMASFLGSQYLHYGEIKALDAILASYQKVERKQIEALFPLLVKEQRWRFHIE